MRITESSVLRLKQCHEEADGVPVEFHIVGSSYTIDQLKKAASDYGLKRVVFHGIKTTDELNEMYEAFDVGLGCLALHRRNADIDTTLKIIEYYCRGIPAVTSGTGPYRDASMTIKVPDNEEEVDIGEIYSAWKKIPRESLLQLSAVLCDFEDTLGKRVDLVTTRSLEKPIRMPSDQYFRNNLQNERIEIYAVA